MYFEVVDSVGIISCMLLHVSIIIYYYHLLLWSMISSKVAKAKIERNEK